MRTIFGRAHGAVRRERRRWLGATMAMASVALGLAGATVLGATPASAAAPAGVSSASSVAMGEKAVCAVTATGGAACWGANDLGQLGNGTTTGSTSAVGVTGLSSGVVAVSGQAATFCALTTAGGVKCWGDNTYGQLGMGTTGGSSTTPVDVTGLTSGVTMVSAGDKHACAALSVGGVKCWGSNGIGQLGTGNTTSSNVPVAVSGTAFNGGVISLSAGFLSTCAVTASNSLLCWGGGGNGQLGNGSTANVTTPTSVSVIGNGTLRVSTGGNLACAISTAGTAYCWGYGGSGAVGNGSTSTPVSTPTVVSGMAAGEARTISAGSDGAHSCASTTSGQVRCWGNNGYGGIGDGTVTQRTTATLVPGLTGIVSVVAGEYSTCALAKTGSLRCWGDDQLGQLGIGTTSLASPPALAAAAPGNVASVSVGLYHACALTTVGGVTCWGSNAQGQWGNGSTTTTAQGAGTTGLSSGVAQVSAGDHHTCARTTAGAVSCWGTGGNGQLGNGVAGASLVPSPVTGISTDAIDVSAGYTHSCAVLSGGTAKCWGDDFDGQLGDGGSSQALSPVSVSLGGTQLTSVSAGDSFTCGVTTTATATCWGWNFYGQLGSGSSTNIFRTPQAVAGLTGVTQVSAGHTSACAVASGAAYCWGRNDRGQLGNGTTSTTAVRSPVAVAGLSGTVTSVTTMEGAACASLTDGAIWCWGDNSNGQLGDGTTTSSLTPVRVQSPARADTALRNSGLGTTACAAASTGSVTCWGYNVLATTGIDPGFSPQPSGAAGAYVTNSAPVAVGPSASIGRRVPTTISWSDTDADGDALGHRNITNPTKGVVSCASGTCTYTSNLGATGSDSFRYEVSDGHGLIDIGTVSITLVNTAPVAGSKTVTAPRRVETLFSLPGSDPNNDAITYTSPITAPTKGTLLCGGPSCGYTSSPGQTGQDSFTYRVSDGSLTSTGTITLDLTNTAPVAQAKAVSVVPTVAKTFSVVATDANLDPLTYTGPASGPSKGSASCTAAGSCTYTSNPGATGTDSFTYGVSDGFGGSDSQTVTVTINPTPEITAARVPAANSFGWANAPVTVSFTCTSGVAPLSCPTPRAFDEGEAQTTTGTVTASDGQTASTTVSGISVDRTAPSGSGVAQGPSAGGWHRDDVTVEWTCQDALSGVATCPSAGTITGEGSSLTTSADVVDKAGNHASITSPTVKIDRTAPTTGASSAPPWFGAAAAIQLTATDNLSGVASTRHTLDGGSEESGTNVAISGDGDHQLTYWSTDVAGNVEEAHTVTVHVDATAPTISGSVSPAPNAAGWNHEPATVTFTCDDATSGVATCTAPSTVSDDGMVDVVGTAFDAAGNTATTTLTIRVDATAPTISATVSGTAGSNGWLRGPATVSWICDDATSGVDGCSPSVTLSADGADQSAPGLVADVAGNTATTTATDIDIDTTAPGITASVTPAAASDGTRTGPATVHFTCADATSGTASCPTDVTVTAVGLTTVPGVAVDVAGNSTTTAVPVTIVNKPVSVSSNANPAVYGQTVTIHGATTLGTTGNLSFYDGLTLLGTKATTTGAADLPTSKLTVGSHSLTVVYKANAAAPAVTSEVLTQTVVAGSTTVDLASVTGPSVAGQVVTLKATVAAVAPASGYPGGTVTFSEGSTVLGTGTLNAGAVSFLVTPTVGAHTYTATYQGSSTFTGRTSAGFTQVVSPAATTTVLSTSPTPSTFGQELTLKAVVKVSLPGVGTAAGMVDFYDGGSLISSQVPSGGIARVTGLKPTVGHHHYTALYRGSADNLASASADVDHVVTPATTTATLVSAFPTTTKGHSGSISAYITIVAPGTGSLNGATVEFYDDGVLLTTATLANGKASIPIALLNRGTHHLTASFGGIEGYLASASTELVQTIT